ncbi:MFS transporter [Lentilactobacillus sp. Marseille-Q4993]|uniref:MFS transporter n=1 Tax=Lentilactobacillus sp. Marseille-Q4993 TaxID=3039492 RepID=UPI0024BC54BB|nr:MFS transporter [Lentilactobacillus sp. Marseille-Q4993]
MKTKYFANIRKSYGYTFLSWFGITGLWVMYLQTKGLSLVQVGLCESIFHIASFLFEVPSGVLADRFSYKLNLILGRLAVIISALLMIASHSFWMFALAFVLNALSYNMKSGTLEALIYDSLKLSDATKKYPKIISNIDVIIEFGDTLGVVIAGFLVHWHFELTYIIAMVFGFIGLVTVLVFKEPVQTKKQITDKVTTKSIIVNSYKTLKANHVLRNLMIFHALFSAVCTAYYYYFQSLMETQHFSGWLISGLMVVSAVINILGIKFTPQFQECVSKRTLLISLSFSLVALLLLSWSALIPLLVGMFLISQMLGSMVEPIFSSFYNEMIDSKQRATLLSVASVLFSAAMIILFPAVGWLIEVKSFSVAFGIIGVILLGLTLIVWRNIKTVK